MYPISPPFLKELSINLFKSSKPLDIIIGDSKEIIKNEIFLLKIFGEIPFSIRIVTNVKQDSFGHITGIDTVDFTPVDTTLELMSFTDAVTDVGSANKEVQVASTILFEDDNGDQQSETATFNMISDNLDVFASGGKAKINFYWGTF